MNDMDSVISALRPRLNDQGNPGSSGSTGGTGGMDEGRAAAMLADITAQPRGEHSALGSVTTPRPHRPVRRVLVGAVAAAAALGVAGPVVMGLLSTPDDVGGDAADCIPRLRHDGIVYIQQTVIERPANDNATGSPAFGLPAGTAVVGTCNDDGTGAGGEVTFPDGAPKVHVIELTNVAPTLALVRPQSNGSAAIFIAEQASTQQVEQILSEVPAAQ